MHNTWKHLSLILLLSVLLFASSCSFFEDNSQTLQYEGTIVPPYITMKNRQATFVFHNLENGMEAWMFDTDILEANIVVGTYMRNVGISELNQLGFTSYSQRFINGSKYINFSGNFSGFSSLDCRPYVQKENFQNMTNLFPSHTDDESKIKEVWNMVTQLCPYTSEKTATTPRLPLETLLFGGGDCKDLAILTASILKGMYPNWTVEFVYMDSNNPSSHKTLNHITVFVDTGNYKTFVESTNNLNMNPYDSVDGFYEIIP